MRLFLYKSSQWGTFGAKLVKAPRSLGGAGQQVSGPPLQTTLVIVDAWAVRVKGIKFSFTMPNTCCAVVGCSNKGKHAFPDEYEMCLKWVVAVRREESDKKGTVWWPRQHSLLCGDHFLPSDYITTTKTGWWFCS
jgi:hypothetical protein